MSRRNLISSFALGLACGLIALPSPALADRDTPAPSVRRPSPPTSSGSSPAVRPAPTASPTAPASASPAVPVGTAGAATERARVAAELARINAEIDALKRSPRGIRDDYRLRNRMADAEAVARRLTELEARSGGPARAVEGTSAPAAELHEVPVGPGDDRADLEAKADILADEARRLTAEANRIETRVTDLRARRELRRRAGQLERDPFSPLEQPKPRMVAVATGAATPQGTSGPKSPGPSRGGGTTTLGTEGSGPAAGSPAAPTAAPGATMGASDSAGGAAPLTPSTTPSATASQSYGVLDPTLLAEVRRLEAPGAPSANLTTLETAVATLRARSTDLKRRAAALRARAAQRAY